LWGVIVIIVSVFGFGIWASTAELSGAVLASGKLVVESNVKKVQHPTGGVVGEIHIKEGDRVKSGDLLIRLDETITRANLQVITNQLDEFDVRQARLEAERDGRTQFGLPDAIKGREAEPALERIIVGERTLLESRRTARHGQISQLRERVAQLDKQISGLEAQQSAKNREIELINEELVGIEKLWVKNLVPITKLMAMRREAARLEGERAQLIASGAESRGKIAEIELQIIQIDQDLRSEVTTELRDIHIKQSELRERRIAAEDQLKRVDIRAPQSGTVHHLTVHTVGGVIGQSEPIMLIVPHEDALVIEVQISPQDIDRVRVGQLTFIRLTAFDQRTTPELDGEVTLVSADLMDDQEKNQAYYTARIVLAEKRAAAALKLIPGMPAEVHIRTGERTLMSYLLKPLSDQFALAFRER
jgi:HlyD family secretion protein